MRRLNLWRIIAAFMVVALTTGATTAAAGEQLIRLNEQEQELWDVVLQHNDLYRKNDIGAWLNYISDDFITWTMGNWTPVDKTMISKWQRHYARNRQPHFYEVTPSVVRVDGDHGFVMYYSTWAETDTHTSPKIRGGQGRYVEAWAKENSVWKLQSDLGGSPGAWD